MNRRGMGLVVTMFALALGCSDNAAPPAGTGAVTPAGSAGTQAIAGAGGGASGPPGGGNGGDAGARGGGARAGRAGGARGLVQVVAARAACPSLPDQVVAVAHRSARPPVVEPRLRVI